MMIRKVFIVAAILAAALGPPRVARAQALPDTVLHPGVRIRVQSAELGSKPRVGNFVSFANDSLYVTVGGQTVPTQIAINKVDALEISVKRTTNVVRDADKGSHVGGIVGAVVGGGVGVASAGGDNSLRALLGLVGAIGGWFAGQLYGTVAGGVAGVVDRGDEWKPVILPAAPVR